MPVICCLFAIYLSDVLQMYAIEIYSIDYSTNIARASK